jgi:hypothetical protein
MGLLRRSDHGKGFRHKNKKQEEALYEHPHIVVGVSDNALFVDETRLNQYILPGVKLKEVHTWKEPIAYSLEAETESIAEQQQSNFLFNGINCTIHEKASTEQEAIGLFLEEAKLTHPDN